MPRINNLTTRRSTSLNSALTRRRSNKVSVTSDEQVSGTAKSNVVSLIATDASPVTDIISSSRQMNTFRTSDYTHVSDIIGKCNRMMAIHYVHDIPLHAEPLHPSLGVTFAVGEGIHDHITNRAIINAPDKVYASWGCSCGKSIVRGTFAEAQEAELPECCNTKHSKHGELVLPHEELRMKGSVDLSMLIDGALYVTEIKSMAKSMFADLARPVPEHIIQVMFYWKFAKDQGYVLHDTVSIIYVQKEFMFSGSPYKEFVIKASEHIHKLDSYIEYAQELKDARDGGKLPPRICGNPDTKDAKKCQMRTTCFGLSE